MAKFRTKPFEIEAIQFTGDNEAEIQALTGTDKFNLVDPEDRTDDPDVVAQVLDILHSTWVGVKVNQWIIKGSKGEFYPCDPEVFEAKYEAVNAPPMTMHEVVRPNLGSSADAIRRGAEWVSDSGGTITSKNDINRGPQQGGRFHNR